MAKLLKCAPDAHRILEELCGISIVFLETAACKVSGTEETRCGRGGRKKGAYDVDTWEPNHQRQHRMLSRGKHITNADAGVY